MQQEPEKRSRLLIITQVNKPTLVLVHNKTLAGQLYGELKELFPENHVDRKSVV